MARIVGGVTTSHIPAIGNAMTNRLEQTPYWKRFFDGYEPVKEWLADTDPDIAIVVYNDHGLNFFLDKMPTMALGCADRYENSDEGWGLQTLATFTGDAAFSWHIAESLVEQEFDLTTCQEMYVDHGFIVPMALMWRHLPEWPVKGIPLAINTIQHPIPSARRLYKLGQALRKAIDSYPEDLKVVIFGTGGMSHQLQGERARHHRPGVRPEVHGEHDIRPGLDGGPDHHADHREGRHRRRGGDHVAGHARGAE